MNRSAVCTVMYMITGIYVLSPAVLCQSEPDYPEPLSSDYWRKDFAWAAYLLQEEETLSRLSSTGESKDSGSYRWRGVKITF